MTPELARRYLEAYRLIRESLTDAELASAIRSGSVERLLMELVSNETLDPSLLRLRLRLDQTLMDVARREAGHLPSWMKPVVFDALSPHVLQAVRSFDGAAIASLREEVRQTVRETVERGLGAGLNPRRIARDLKGSIGLGAQQAEAVATFREQLLSGDRAALQRALGKGVIRRPDGSTIVRAAHAGGQGLTKAQLATLDRLLGREAIPRARVERMVEAYRKRLIAWNTEAHARTATLQAQKLGHRLAWEDAIERGVVARHDLRRRWFTNLDGRERPEHHNMHGETVGFDEPFSNGEMTPGSSTFNCRCLARVFVSRAARAA